MEDAAMAFTGSYAFDGEAAALKARIARLDRISRLLDTAFVVPGTQIRFGIDAILGLVPVVGDWAGVALSTIVVVEAARIGIPKLLLARMIANIAVEGGIGMVPLVGDLFDVFFRANRRNLALLVKHLEREGRL
jgi:hypothetical protein